MGKVRARPRLLPEKLRIIRHHLQLTQSKMAEILRLNARRVSDYEHGRRGPASETVLAYAYAAKVRMDLIVDDEISSDSFRASLGMFNHGRVGIKASEATE